MKNYEDIGLTDRLVSTSSLMAKTTYTTSFDFDSDFEGASAQQIVSGRVRGKILINDGTNDRVMIGKLD